VRRAARFQLVTRPGHPTFLDLPWDRPLDEWEGGRLVDVVRGISRHVVRFVDYDGQLYALKELPQRYAEREYRLLRRLAEESMPVVDVVGVVSKRPEALDDVLITRHLEFSIPYRALFSAHGVPDLRSTLLNAMAELLVRLHLAGFFWGDCSLSNTLFRRDAGGLSAYLVDAETGELHPRLTDGQRAHDLALAEENVVGELLDVAAERGELPSGIDPVETAAEGVRRYVALWNELTRDDLVATDERFRIEERLRRLNELGFDVEEIELDATPEGYRLRLQPQLVEPGHHRRRLLMLTGLSAQENQARRMLHDLDEFRARLDAPESVAAYRWRAEVFEPAMAAVPAELWTKREPAEVFHEILEHRWLLSERRGSDVGLDVAVRDYVDGVLRHAADERSVLAPDDG
jgi:tRNA A-37 threonylcarbamoyl transferase component Bud32